MALPSSPPLLPTIEEQDFPSNSVSHLQLPTRKRQHSDYASLSSDPIFSDDTEEDSSQDAPRRKRVVRGPWWNLRKRGMMVKKDAFRNADSGVFMGSDGSEESIDSVLESRQRMQGLAMSSPEAPQSAEQTAERRVQSCVDSCKEAVDLSGHGLTTISDATLRPLHQLIRGSFREHTHPPSEDEFTPLTPSIQLMLYTNHLKTLPNELFNLRNITVLSIRNNDLSFLPPAIARLDRLTELNIAGNGIRYLPWELLELIHCRGSKHRQITVRPNPLLEPCDLSGPSPLPKGNMTPASREDLSRFADTRETISRMRERCREEGVYSVRAELELRLKLGRMLRIQGLQAASQAGEELRLCREELIYLASSEVRYFDPDGGPVRRVDGRPSTASELWSAVITPTAPPSGASTVPSLFELALRKLQSTHNLTEALSSLPGSGLPPAIQFGIRLAAQNSESHGNESCSTCGREYVVKRAEWMEYWFHGYPSQQELTTETVLPFLRKACSWGCAQATEVGAFRT